MQSGKLQFANVDELRKIVDGLDTAELRDLELSGKKLSEYKAVWNTNKDVLMTVIDAKNLLIQHKAAFDLFLNAAQKKGIEDLSGVVKNFGGQAIIEAQIPGLQTVLEGEDTINMGVRLENSYLGSKPAFKSETFGFRNVCSNGMLLGQVLVAKVFAGHAKIGNLEVKMSEFLSATMEKSINLSAILTEAKGQILEVEQAREIINGEVGTKKIVTAISDVLETDGKTTNKYQLYNATTYFATHNAKNEQQRVWVQRVAQKILTTPVSKLRQISLKDEDTEFIGDGS